MHFIIGFLIAIIIGSLCGLFKLIIGNYFRIYLIIPFILGKIIGNFFNFLGYPFSRINRLLLMILYFIIGLVFGLSYILLGYYGIDQLIYNQNKNILINHGNRIIDDSFSYIKNSINESNINNNTSNNISRLNDNIEKKDLKNSIKLFILLEEEKTNNKNEINIENMKRYFQIIYKIDQSIKENDYHQLKNYIIGYYKYSYLKGINVNDFKNTINDLNSINIDYTSIINKGFSFNEIYDYSIQLLNKKTTVYLYFIKLDIGFYGILIIEILEFLFLYFGIESTIKNLRRKNKIKKKTIKDNKKEFKFVSKTSIEDFININLFEIFENHLNSFEKEPNAIYEIKIIINKSKDINSLNSIISIIISPIDKPYKILKKIKYEISQSDTYTILGSIGKIINNENIKFPKTNIELNQSKNNIIEENEFQTRLPSEDNFKINDNEELEEDGIIKIKL